MRSASNAIHYPSQPKHRSNPAFQKREENARNQALYDAFPSNTSAASLALSNFATVPPTPSKLLPNEPVPLSQPPLISSHLLIPSAPVLESPLTSSILAVSTSCLCLPKSSSSRAIRAVYASAALRGASRRAVARCSVRASICAESDWIREARRVS